MIMDQVEKIDKDFWSGIGRMVGLKVVVDPNLKMKYI